MNAASGMQVVAQNVADVYEGPDAGSGLASQALLGDIVRVTDTQGDFCRVTTGDRYGGWVATRLLVPARDDLDSLTTTIATLFADVFSAPDAHSEMLTKLVVGTTVVVARRAEVGDWVPLLLPDGQIGYVHKVSLNLTYSHRDPLDIGHFRQPLQELDLLRALGDQVPHADLIAALGRNITETAKRFIGTPYLWGGCTPFGIDCSGLTQVAYKLNGVQLLRDADLQFADRRFGRVEEGQSLDTAVLEDGDLVIFSRRVDKQPTHIGLALGDGRFLHARGGQGVRIDDCDVPEYVEKYLGAVRLSPDAEFAVEAA